MGFRVFDREEEGRKFKRVWNFFNARRGFFSSNRYCVICNSHFYDKQKRAVTCSGKCQFVLEEETNDFGAKEYIKRLKNFFYVL